jgi:hypothetical protein
MQNRLSQRLPTERTSKSADTGVAQLQDVTVTDRILHCASLRLLGQPSCGRIAWASKGQYEIGLARLKFRFLRTPLRDLRGLAQHYQNDESIQTLIRRSSMRVRSSCVCKIAPCHRALLACGNGLPPRCTGVDLRVRLETKKTRRHHRVG